MKVCALIMAAGSGKRMGGSIKKQYLKIGDKEILRLTAENLAACPCIDEIAIVTADEDMGFVRNVLKGIDKIKAFAAGGSERQYSVHNGLKALKGCDIVLIHDGVRPFVRHEDIEKCVSLVKKGYSCVLGVPVKDTVKVCDSEGVVTATPDRKTLWSAQTPQCFKYKDIAAAYEKAAAEGFLGTDDASVAEFCGLKIKMAEGSYDNIKITTPEDLILGEAILKSREGTKGDLLI